MTPNDLTYEQIYSPHSKEMIKKWVGRNQYNVVVVFGDTRKECYKEARKYCDEYNKRY